MITIEPSQKFMHKETLVLSRAAQLALTHYLGEAGLLNTNSGCAPCTTTSLFTHFVPSSLFAREQAPISLSLVLSPHGVSLTSAPPPLAPPARAVGDIASDSNLLRCHLG